MDINKKCLNCFNSSNGDLSCPYCGYEGKCEDHSILTPGTILNGKYIVGKMLGRGGFGITYLAFSINLQIKVCIKEYFPDTISTRENSSLNILPYSGEAQTNFIYGRDKYIEEGRTLAQFNWLENTVSIFDFFVENNTGYLVMEYLEGNNLLEILQTRKGNKISLEETVQIIDKVLLALEELHKVGIIHRDISPDNIIITNRGQIKLIDFGAARYAMGEKSQSLSVILKKGFAPAEQYSSKGKQGVWTDIYAIGATFYKMLTGITPADAVDRITCEDEIEYPDYMDSDIVEFLEKAMSLKSNERFQSANEMIETLSTVSSSCKDLRANSKQNNTFSQTESVAQQTSRSIPSLGENSKSEDVIEDKRKEDDNLDEIIPDIPEKHFKAEELDNPKENINEEQAENEKYIKIFSNDNESSKSWYQYSLTWIIIIGMTAFFIIAGILNQSGKTNNSIASMVLEVQLNPSRDAAKMEVLRKPLQDLLSEKLDMEVEVTIATDYNALIEAMASEQVHVGILETTRYVLAADEGHAEAILKSLRYDVNDDGTTMLNDPMVAGYYSQLLVHKDSGITDVVGLKGKRIAVSSFTSTSGFVWPANLLADAGLNPEEDVEWIIAGGHDNAILAMMNGDADAAFTFKDARTTLFKEEYYYDDIMETCVFLMNTSIIPYDTISVIPSMDDDLKAKIKQAFLDITETEGEIAIMCDLYRHEGYAEATDVDYNKVREYLERRDEWSFE